jgi:hypothetical protein
MMGKKKKKLNITILSDLSKGEQNPSSALDPIGQERIKDHLDAMSLSLAKRAVAPLSAFPVGDKTASSAKAVVNAALTRREGGGWARWWRAAARAP